jgi:hypothetical protein
MSGWQEFVAQVIACCCNSSSNFIYDLKEKAFERKKLFFISLFTWVFFSGDADKSKKRSKLEALNEILNCKMA